LVVVLSQLYRKIQLQLPWYPFKMTQSRFKRV
jgi:hypothetical protein